MNILIPPPIYDAKQGCHRFELDGGSPIQFLCAEATGIPCESLTSEVLSPILTAFLEQTKRYFKKPLEEEFVTKRLVHAWKEGVPRDGVEGEGGAVASWIPASLSVYPTKIILTWTFVEWEESAPPGSEGEAAEVPAPAAPEPAPAAPEPAPVAPEPAPAAPEPAPAAPERPPSPPAAPALQEQEPDLTTAPPSLEGKAKAKHAVRKARLRALLAQVRAEKLAERYYRKYGTFDGLEGDDSESDLSWPSDAEVEATFSR